MERIYYKITDKTHELYLNVSSFLSRERVLADAQKKAVVSKVPEFTKFRGMFGFNRIVEYRGFIFNDQEHIDPKVWTTKRVEGYMLSIPNKRTKAGKEMAAFLHNFERTTSIEMYELLGVSILEGNHYTPNAFLKDDIVYITIDSRSREEFECRNDDGFVEITNGEFTNAIK